MEIIPVIDIRIGRAVRAIAGRRDEYRPLETPLAETSEPREVARGLMSLHPFCALYIADLDAIEGRGDNRDAIAGAAQAIAPARLWIDAGFARRADALRWSSLPATNVVFGSESLASAQEAEGLRHDPRAILSLDFSADGFLGDPRLLGDEALWPDGLIVMTLAQVGAKAGPDLARLRDIAARANGRRVYAAGGVRDLDDLLDLKAAGAAGALVATALHDGRLTAADLASLSAIPPK